MKFSQVVQPPKEQVLFNLGWQPVCTAYSMFSYAIIGKYFHVKEHEKSFTSIYLHNPGS